MRIWHRVTFNSRKAVDSRIEDLHINSKRTPALPGSYLTTFEIDETDSRWPAVESLIKDYGGLDVFDTVFSKDEILGATWNRLIPTYERGYPQPESTWTLSPPNYESYCCNCGTYRQAEPFRLAKEPILGKHEFLTLYWTYAILATPRVFTTLKDRQVEGYEIWDAIIHRTGTVSAVVSQLYVPHLAHPGLEDALHLGQTTCPECGATKYQPHRRGKMQLKQTALPSELDIIQTHEWFGSGHNAFREIVISNKLSKLIVETGWQGVRLKVVEAV